MTIPNTARKAGPLLGTGSQTAWPFTFKVFAAGDVQVTIANSAGTETLLALGTDYTVTLNSNQETSPGGTVNYPISGAALPVGSVLAIIGDLDYDQPLDLPSGGNFSPTALENQLDRSTMQIQQLREEMNRTAKLPPTSTESVEALVDDLQRIADSADNMDTIVANLAAVNTVASDLNEPVSEINTVATSIANVNTVGNNITNVNTVAGISANVTTVAGIAANVTTVAGIATNVTAVAGNATNINTVAGNNANVTAVGANITNVNTVAANEVSIDTVAGIASNVSAVAAIDDAVNIAAANVADINNFADVYQGGKATDPTVRNDGSALQSGDLYFNTTLGRMRIRVFGVWDDAVSNAGSVVVESFSGTGSQTAFTLATDPLDKANTQVFIAGVYQQKSEYNVLGTTLTFTAAPTSGTSNIEVVIATPVAFGNLSTIQADVTTKAATATTQAGIATTQAGIATTQAGIATTQAGLAATAKTAAEAARDAAIAAAKTYTTTAAGIAATTSGQVFLVTTADLQAYLVYSNSAGSAMLLGTLNIANGLLIREKTYDGLAYVLQDSAFNVALKVDSAGNVSVHTISAVNLNAETINGLTKASIDSAVAVTSDLSVESYDALVYVIQDSEFKIAFGVKSDGTIVIGALNASSASLGSAQVTSLTATTLNGNSVSELINKVNTVISDAIVDAGNYTAELNYISNNGQSLAETYGTAVVAAQEYDNITLNGGRTAFDALAAGTGGESPLFGTLSSAKQLIADQDGVSYTQHTYQLIGANNLQGGTALLNLAKGGSTGKYESTIADVQACYNLAQTAGKLFKFQAVTWTQGESDYNNASYKTQLIQLINDFNTDGKAITGQTEDVILIEYQTPSSGTQKVGLLQLEAANENARIVMASPIYFMTFYDSAHIDAVSRRWLGAYYGLAYKRVKVDGVDWKPLQPLSVERQGKVMYARFNPAYRPLTFDTGTTPEQPNKGFALYDSSNNELPISSVSIVNGDTVKVVATNAVPSGAKLTYALKASTNRGAFTGGSGNLRDVQGNYISHSAIAKRMDNWCTSFSIAV